jgi:hypothetical protein
LHLSAERLVHAGGRGFHTVAVMNQTPVRFPPPRRSFWARLSPIQRVGLIAAALILPCCGGLTVVGALSGAPTPAATTAPVAEQLAGDSATSTPASPDTITRKPVTEVVAVGTKVATDERCDPNYDPCVPIASDVDCAGGSGNGPAYVDGPVHVIGDDPYDLDRDGDGIACDR